MRYYAYSVPVRELRQGFPETPAQVRRTYPDACGVIFVADGPIVERHAELVDGVKHGDILLFRAWFRDTKFNDEVIKIYQEAAGK